MRSEHAGPLDSRADGINHRELSRAPLFLLLLIEHISTPRLVRLPVDPLRINGIYPVLSP